MPLKPKKPASKILIHIGVRKFLDHQVVEEWDSWQGPPIKLGDKISEYLLRIGDANSFCLNIVIQLLTRGKVRVDFRDTSERLELVDNKDTMTRPEAVMVFDHWFEENLAKSEPPETTQKIVVDLPRVKLPRKR